MRELILNKLLSARFFMAIAFSITLCIGFLAGAVESQVFTPVVLIVVKDYFDRRDRAKEGGTGNGS